MGEYMRFLWESLPSLLVGFPGQRPGGLLLSLLLAVVAITAGFGLALLVSGGALSRRRWLRWLAVAYVEFLRGVPLILLLVLVHQGIGGERFGLRWTPRTSALVALTLYSSAYQAEIVRAGLQTVPRALLETARLLGSGPWQTYVRVELRYTVKVMLPAFTGQAISLFKDTSVVLILGVADLMTVARLNLGTTIVNAPYWVGMYVLVGLLYFSVAYTLSRLTQRWERSQRRGDLVYSLAAR